MMAALPEIQINTDAAIRREAISEDHDCVIVDNFLQNPDEIAGFAAEHASEFSMPERGYPGVQLLLNEEAMRNVYHFVRSRMSKQFPFLRGGMRLWSFLSMVTMRPDQLLNLQRLCHTDPNPSPGRTIYAALVYLFEDQRLGGTGFYRWKENDLRRKAAAIDREDPAKGLAFLQENFPTYRKPACYMTASNEIAERLCTIPSRFNRMIFYWGKVPHSGAITAPELLSKDIRKGRLTLNIFADVSPKFTG